MESSFDLESVDLASVRAVLEDRCGPFVEGEVVGRTQLRDEVARHLGCSALEAEHIVDILIGRRLVRPWRDEDGRVGWSTAPTPRT